MYVVLEIADSDFKKLFRAPVYLTELHIKTLLYNLLVGVKYVHSAGILHRDLVSLSCSYNKPNKRQQTKSQTPRCLTSRSPESFAEPRHSGTTQRLASRAFAASSAVAIFVVFAAAAAAVEQKPANCLVNQDCSVKVCDFGLARTMDFPERQNSHCPVTQQHDDIVSVSHTKNLKRQLTGHVVTR